MLIPEGLFKKRYFNNAYVGRLFINSLTGTKTIEIIDKDVPVEAGQRTDNLVTILTVKNLDEDFRD